MAKVDKVPDRSDHFFIECECSTVHHTIEVSYYDWGLRDSPEFYFELQSDMPFGFFTRVKRAFNYVFFGERLRWHDVIPKREHLVRLQGLIADYLERADMYDAHCKIEWYKKKEAEGKESNETL